MQESPTMSARAQASSPATKSAVIGPGIEISGDVTASADLTIDGRVGGSVVQSAHNVEIGESGQVSARIQAKMVKVAGEVIGDIAGSEKVLIARTGRVRGNISAPRVQLEDGAIFKGSIDMEPAQTASAKAPAVKKDEKSSTGFQGGHESAGPGGIRSFRNHSIKRLREKGAQLDAQKPLAPGQETHRLQQGNR